MPHPVVAVLHSPAEEVQVVGLHSPFTPAYEIWVHRWTLPELVRDCWLAGAPTPAPVLAPTAAPATLIAPTPAVAAPLLATAPLLPITVLPSESNTSAQ